MNVRNLFEQGWMLEIDQQSTQSSIFSPSIIITLEDLLEKKGLFPNIRHFANFQMYLLLFFQTYSLFILSIVLEIWRFNNKYIHTRNSDFPYRWFLSIFSNVLIIITYWWFLGKNPDSPYSFYEWVFILFYAGTDRVCSGVVFGSRCVRRIGGPLVVVLPVVDPCLYLPMGVFFYLWCTFEGFICWELHSWLLVVLFVWLLFFISTLENIEF
jgi:hypothetical protein